MTPTQTADCNRNARASFVALLVSRHAHFHFSAATVSISSAVTETELVPAMILRATPLRATRVPVGTLYSAWPVELSSDPVPTAARNSAIIFAIRLEQVNPRPLGRLRFEPGRAKVNHARSVGCAVLECQRCEAEGHDAKGD